MDKYATNFDKLTLLFLFDSEKNKSQGAVQQLLVPLVQEMKDLISVYAYDCRDEVVKQNPKRFESCSKPEELPYIWLLKPPAEWVNPITLEKRVPESIPYNNTEVSSTTLYKYIKNNLPDLTQRIETEGQHDNFKESMIQADINKVLIISNKNKPSMEIKGIA